MKGVLRWDCNIIIFFLFTVQNCGVRESADSAQWRKLDSFTTNFYAEITSCWQFESEHLDSQLPVIAKWEHIEKLYKHDRHFMIRMLYKLTDTHLAPVT